MSRRVGGAQCVARLLWSRCSGTTQNTFVLPHLGACQLNLCSIPIPPREWPMVRGPLPVALSRSCRIWQDCSTMAMAIHPLGPIAFATRDSSSSLRRLVATFFMSSCDRRHKLCTRRDRRSQRTRTKHRPRPRPRPGQGRAGPDSQSARGLQSLCQQKLFLTATTTAAAKQHRSELWTRDPSTWLA